MIRGNNEKSIKVLGVSEVCPNIKGQGLRCAIQIYDFAKDLKLADESEGEASIDMLISAHFYGKFVTDKMKRSNTCILVTIKSILSWVICGPNESNHKDHHLVNVSTPHVVEISFQERNN